MRSILFCGDFRGIKLIIHQRVHYLFPPPHAGISWILRVTVFGCIASKSSPNRLLADFPLRWQAMAATTIKQPVQIGTYMMCIHPLTLEEYII